MSFILISTDKRILSLPLSIYPEIPALYCKLEREKKKVYHVWTRTENLLVRFM